MVAPRMKDKPAKNGAETMLSPKAIGRLRDEGFLSGSGTNFHAEVVLYAVVPGVVVCGAQVHPLFIGHGFPPAKEWERIRSDRDVAVARFRFR